MRVVVSLTTIPGRADLLERAIDSLVRQTRPADAIYLWMPRERFAAIEDAYRFEGVRVALGADLGPAMKLLPVLGVEEDPDTLIIPVDDDIEYPPELIDRLVRSAAILPGHAVGFTGWCVGEAEGGGLGIHHRNESVLEAGILQGVHVLEGYRGVLYRRGFFEPDVFDHLGALDAFRFHDDILLSGYLASRGIPRTVRWLDLGSPPPGGAWRLHGDSIGLHTGDDWLRQGRACLEYWARRAPGFLDPIPTRSPVERLQLNARRRPRPGFTHHGLSDSGMARDLLDYPWPWPDASMREVLALDDLPVAPAAWVDWLQECHRILCPGGVLKLCVPKGSCLPDCAAPGWRCAWEPDGDGLIGTFIKGESLNQ